MYSNAGGRQSLGVIAVAVIATVLCATLVAGVAANVIGDTSVSQDTGKVPVDSSSLDSGMMTGTGIRKDVIQSMGTGMLVSGSLIQADNETANSGIWYDEGPESESICWNIVDSGILDSHMDLYVSMRMPSKSPNHPDLRR